MKYKNIESIKEYTCQLFEKCAQQSKWHEELAWFSKNHYTTTSEYLGELNILIDRMLEDHDMKMYHRGLHRLKADINLS